MMYKKLLEQGLFGIEKEGLRIDENGKLSLIDRTSCFSDKNMYIKTDFSQSQSELITPPQATIREACNLLSNLQDVTLNQIETECLWPQSNPCKLPPEKSIPLSKVESKQMRQYLEYLASKYGKKRAIVCGVHFNASFSNELMQEYQLQCQNNQKFLEFQNDCYLKVAKYSMKYRYLFVYLFGASSYVDETFDEEVVGKSTNKQGNYIIGNMHSLRNSAYGYQNIQSFTLDYTSLKTYNVSLQSLIHKGILQGASENYSALRLKGDASHIEYLEFRFLDIDPFSYIGVQEQDLQFLHLFMLYFLHQENFDYTTQMQETAQKLSDNVALGYSLDYLCNNGKVLREEAMQLVDDMTLFFQEQHFDLYDVETLSRNYKMQLMDSTQTKSNRLKQEIKHSGYIAFHKQKALEYKQQAKNQAYQMKGFEHLELSTQLILKNALLYGLEFEVLDATQNFIRLKDPLTNQIEYIKEATKTSLDTYSQVLVMENKIVTKKVLKEKKLQVPNGYEIMNVEEGMQLFQDGNLGFHLVVKPNNTNFGQGITILNKGFHSKQLEKALCSAFQMDSRVLLEKFQEGKEYRFLVINEHVEGVLFRRAASVKGDGVSTIEELVAIKNENPLRGNHYKKPLEKITLGKEEERVLAQSNHSIKSILGKNERAYLRFTSNISTGGDSIEVSNSVDQSYKLFAIQAAKAVGVKIAGVDMILKDAFAPATCDNYSILELNFNPAIHIHEFPYSGTGKKVAEKVIEALFVSKQQKTM